MIRRNKVELSVVVPVFNEKGSIVELFEEILFSLKELKKSFEIIIVDDGSTDGTAGVLEKLKPVKIITLRMNCGQSAALETGIQNSQGKIVITLDGDGQNDPKDFPILLKKLEEGYDAVCGWRYQRKDPRQKKLISMGARWLRSFLVNDEVHDAGCTLRTAYRYCYEEVHFYGELHRMIPALLKLNGFKYTEVKVSHRPRTKGRTKYGTGRIIRGFLDMFQVWLRQKYGMRPLYLFGQIGVILILGSTTLFGLLALLRIFGEYRLSDKIWPLVAMLGMITGVQLLIFGIMADLIIRNNSKWLATPIRSIIQNE